MGMSTVVRERFTIGEYAQMSAAGVLDEDDRVELAVEHILG